jgi:hypothetical protein
MVDSNPATPPGPQQDPREAERQQRRRESRERYKAADPERARRQHVESQRCTRQRQRAEEARRKLARQRVRDWTAANPERARARKEAWKQQHPERVREHKRNYYARNREQRQRAAREQNARRRQDPSTLEQEQQYRAANRDRLNEQQRARRSDPNTRARDNQVQNERRRLDRRLRKLGLPSHPAHRTTLNERAANADAAERFFTRKRSVRDVRILREELAEVRDEASLASVERWRAALEARIQADAERPARIRGLLDKYLATTAGSTLREDVRMDSIARQLRGAGAYSDPTAELRRRALAALVSRRTALTTPSSPARRHTPVERSSMYVGVGLEG